MGKKDKDLAPLTYWNLRQKEYAEAIDRCQITFAQGPPGTAKTLWAIYKAVESLDRGEIHKIFVTRPNPFLASERAIGDFPGDVHEKLAHTMHSVKDNLACFMTEGRAKYLLEKKTIEVLPIEHVRGRSLSRVFWVIEEGQNITQTDMLALMSRLCDDSKMVCTGDYRGQRDLNHKFGMSGLQDAEYRLQDIDEIAFVDFGVEDICRSGLVKKIMERYADLYQRH